MCLQWNVVECSCVQEKHQQLSADQQAKFKEIEERLKANELKMAADCGVACFRVATHCTEADVSGQHIGMSRELGIETVGFLMMAHMVEPDELARQGKIQEDFGAQTSRCQSGYCPVESIRDQISDLHSRHRWRGSKHERGSRPGFTLHHAQSPL